MTESPKRASERQTLEVHDTVACLLNQGFVCVTGSPELSVARDAVFDAARRFFALPVVTKEDMAWAGQGMWSGYQPLPQGDITEVDLVERFEVTTTMLSAKGQCSASPVEDLYTAMGSLLNVSLPYVEALVCSAATARGRDVAEAHSLWIANHASTVVANYYPAISPYPIAMKPHQDFAGLTLIFFDESGSASDLEFHDGAQWRPLNSNTFACAIVGQLLGGWLGCHATVHRVRRSSTPRYSIAVFHQPALEHVIPFRDGRSVRVDKHIEARQAEYNALESRKKDTTK